MKIKNLQIISLALMIGVLSYLSSCTKLAQTLNKTFTLQTPAQNFTIPAIPNIAATLDTLPSISGSFNYNIDSFIKASTGNVLSISNLKNVKITNCILTLSNASDSSNFQDFSKVYLYFHSSANSTPFLLSALQPDTFASVMTLLPQDTSANLQNYMTGSTFNYSVTGAMRRGTKDSLHCSAVITFSINVQG